MSLSGIVNAVSQPFVLLLKLVLPSRFFFKDISYETVLITAGGQGLGQEIALKVSSLGAHVIIVDGDRCKLEETARLIIKSGGTCSSYLCDVSQRDYVYTIAEKIKESNGFVSIIINAAQVQGADRRLSELNDERIIKTMQVNTLSHFWFIKAFLPEMKERNHGHIVNISSHAGLLPSLALADFAASKFAIIGLTESLTLELQRDGYTGIHTTLVCPYIVDSAGKVNENNSRFKVSPLDVKYVAQEVMNAIQLNKQYLIVPSSLNILFILKSILPPVIGSQVHRLFKRYSVAQSITHNGHITGDTTDRVTVFYNNNNDLSLSH